MKCPKCGCEKSSCLDTRMTVKDQRRRRYCCKDCGQRFTTYEIHAEHIKKVKKIAQAMADLI